MVIAQTFTNSNVNYLKQNKTIAIQTECIYHKTNFEKKYLATYSYLLIYCKPQIALWEMK